MRLPLRLPARHRGYKWLAAAVIAALAYGVSASAHRLPFTSIPMNRLDDVLYDSLYRLRKPEDRTQGPVVIVAVDDKSLDALDNGYVNGNRYGWPWPRALWGHVVTYLNQCGARVVTFDVLFRETTTHSRDGDDEEFADCANASAVPLVFATIVSREGTPDPFVPPVKNPVFGAANINQATDVYRAYAPLVYGMPSLASRSVQAYSPGTGFRADPFLLHYYGPHQFPDGRRTHTFLSAANVIGAALNKPDTGVAPEMFRGKIVLIGAISAGLYDTKASPLSNVYPGVEVHATAMENLLNNQSVHVLPPAVRMAVGFALCLAASAGVIRPRQVLFKLLAAIAAAMLLVGVAVLLFTGHTPRSLPMATPVFAMVLTTVGAMGWSYLTEDRQRRLIFRALSQAVSPEMAAEIGRNPDRLKLGGERREMTVMFTDIAGFTDLSENMDVERLTTLMNFYLEEMSALVLEEKGYVDKYIGDAIMSFWNGVLPQSDHALRACRTALRMQQREREMQSVLRAMGVERVLTRIGINSGAMAIGNMGSSLKFAYTVLGDSVNLASRLEGANKLYGSQILLAHSTAQFVRGAFVIRELDLLRVKGKQKPMAVYELMAEGQGDDALRRRVSGYESALALYRGRRWADVTAALQELLRDFPDDAPAIALLERVQALREDPPPSDWDGVYVAKTK